MFVFGFCVKVKKCKQTDRGPISAPNRRTCGGLESDDSTFRQKSSNRMNSEVWLAAEFVMLARNRSQVK